MKTKLFFLAFMSLFLFAACGKGDEPKPIPTPDVDVPVPNPDPKPDPDPDPIAAPYYMTLTTEKSVGATIKLGINGLEADKEGMWIDLNNNGKKENGEEVVYGANEYKIGSQTVVVYGKIKSLECHENELTKLDLSKNAVLEFLNCQKNSNLKELDVSANKALKGLYCGNIGISQLNLSANNALETLYCSNNKLLAKLDVSAISDLKYFDCSNNILLTELDVSANKNLVNLYVYNCKLATLNITNSNNLEKIYCFNNQITALDVSNKQKLEELGIHQNNIDNTEMQAIVDNIRTCDKDSEGIFMVFAKESGDKNKITKTQVSVLQNKNWKVVDMHHFPYEGQ